MNTMYRRLLRIPLFNGISHKRMLEMTASTRLHFIKFGPDHEIAVQGEPCESLHILMGGSVRITHQLDDMTLEYTVDGPQILFANAMFGRHTSFPARITAINEVSVITISKQEYMQLLSSDPIYMFNLLNNLSAMTQRAYEVPAFGPFGDVRRTLMSVMYTLTPRHARDIRGIARYGDRLEVIEVATGDELRPEKQ